MSGDFIRPLARRQKARAVPQPAVLYRFQRRERRPQAQPSEGRRHPPARPREPRRERAEPGLLRVLQRPRGQRRLHGARGDLSLATSPTLADRLEADEGTLWRWETDLRVPREERHVLAMRRFLLNEFEMGNLLLGGQGFRAHQLSQRSNRA